MAVPVELTDFECQWPKLTDGRWWKLTKGVDFGSTPMNASKAARKWGREHGYKVSVRLGEDHVIVRFLPQDSVDVTPARIYHKAYVQ